MNMAHTLHSVGTALMHRISSVWPSSFVSTLPDTTSNSCLEEDEEELQISDE
jgi:hypothetical protein